MGAPAIRESRLSKGNKTRVPEPKQDPGCKLGFPVGLLRDNVMHEREQTVRVILNLDVNVEFDVLVLRLMTKLHHGIAMHGRLGDTPRMNLPS